MFNLTSAHRYFLCNEPTDMRKGFDGLSRLVQTHFKADPMNGSMYVFLNKNRNLDTYLEKKKLLNQKIWLIASPILNYDKATIGVKSFCSMPNAAVYENRTYGGVRVSAW